MCNDIPEKDAERVSKLWGKCRKIEFDPDVIFKGSSGLVKLYHATTRENSASILLSGEFLIPTRRYAIENGLKLGAAVYFGFDPSYCVSEAKNTQSNEGKEIVIIRAEVNLGRCVDLGNYDDGNNFSWKDWEWMTERLTKDEVMKSGIDSICINRERKSLEIAIYDPQNQIKGLAPFETCS